MPAEAAEEQKQVALKEVATLEDPPEGFIGPFRRLRRVIGHTDSLRLWAPITQRVLQVQSFKEVVTLGDWTPQVI